MFKTTTTCFVSYTITFTKYMFVWETHKLFCEYDRTPWGTDGFAH